MTWDEVADLISKIPQELTVNEFLIELATRAAQRERDACIEIAQMENMAQSDIVRVIRARNNG